MSFSLSGPFWPLVGPGVLGVAAVAAIAIFVGPTYISRSGGIMPDPVGVSSDYDNIEDGDGALLEYYDYIVVGAGSAGCVIASRLSEDPSVSVLLLEAGGVGSLVNYIPGLTGTFYNTETDWNYKSEPDGKSCLGHINGRCPWHRGRLLGGSSAVNGMAYVRGHPEDFDEWAAFGNYGWSYDEVLPYFLKSENQLDKKLRKDTKYHATGGYLDVGRFPYRTKSAYAFMEAAASVGLPETDINGVNMIGSMFYPVTVSPNGRRASSASAFLRPARKRKNLRVVVKAMVSRVLLEQQGGYGYGGYGLGGQGARATGVVFHRHGKTFRVKCRREVILSAGALESPKLLMLSGIGPRAHLESLGIPVVQDLPVGYNLDSHVGNAEMIFALRDRVSFDPFAGFVYPNNLAAYFLNGRGPLAAHGFEAIAYVRTGVSDRYGAHGTAYAPKPYEDPYGTAYKPTNFSKRPDVQIYFSSITVATDGGQIYRRAENLNDRQFNQYRALSFKPAYMVFPMLVHAKSRGRVSLKSTDYRQHPLIEANFLDDPIDVLTLIEASKICLKIGEAPAFRRYGGRFYPNPNPGCAHLEFQSDAYWECVIRHHTWSSYHDSGTCKMGPPTDPWAVVDPELRVYGVPNLRVADASIMPEITSGNINAPIIMIGEKAADLIKATAYYHAHGGYPTYGQSI